MPTGTETDDRVECWRGFTISSTICEPKNGACVQGIPWIGRHVLCCIIKSENCSHPTHGQTFPGNPVKCVDTYLKVIVSTSGRVLVVLHKTPTYSHLQDLEGAPGVIPASTSGPNSYRVRLCGTPDFTASASASESLLLVPRDTAMGYTVYWQQRECSAGAWRSLQRHVTAILAAAAQRGIECRVIELNSRVIAFAGPEGETCEDFCVHRSYSSSNSDSDSLCFCKTMMRAYDPVVKAVVIKMCALGIAYGMSTDAAWDEAKDSSHAQLAQELLSCVE